MSHDAYALTKDNVLKQKMRWMWENTRLTAHHMNIVLHHHGYENLRRGTFQELRRAHGMMSMGANAAKDEHSRRSRAKKLLNINDPRFSLTRAAMLEIEKVGTVPVPAVIRRKGASGTDGAQANGVQHTPVNGPVNLLPNNMIRKGTLPAGTRYGRFDLDDVANQTFQFKQVKQPTRAAAPVTPHPASPPPAVGAAQPVSAQTAPFLADEAAAHDAPEPLADNLASIAARAALDAIQEPWRPIPRFEATKQPWPVTPRIDPLIEVQVQAPSGAGLLTMHGTLDAAPQGASGYVFAPLQYYSPLLQQVANTYGACVQHLSAREKRVREEEIDPNLDAEVAEPSVKKPKRGYL